MGYFKASNIIPRFLHIHTQREREKRKETEGEGERQRRSGRERETNHTWMTERESIPLCGVGCRS